MKNKIFYFGLFIIGVVILNACYYDEVVQFEGLPTNVSFKNDVMPIFDKNCNTAGCHDAAGSHSPSLVLATAYDALSTGNYINTLDPVKSVLYKEISTGSMPPSGALDINNQKIILGWITDGAKEN